VFRCSTIAATIRNSYPSLVDALHNYLQVRLAISQTDQAEKTQQVRIIANIFARANVVCGWLGEHADNSEYFLRHKIGTDLTLSPKWMAAAERFWSRAYWNRTWITQEIAVAQRLIMVCGNIEMPWEQLMYRLRLPFEHPIAGRIHSLVNQRQISTPTYDIWAAARTFRTTNCRDPRDHVYALLSLAKQAPGDPDLPADYTISTLQMYLNLFEIRSHYLHAGFPLAEFFAQMHSIDRSWDLSTLLTSIQEGIDADHDGGMGWQRFQRHEKQGDKFIPVSLQDVLARTEKGKCMYYFDSEEGKYQYVDLSKWYPQWKPPMKDRFRRKMLPPALR
jgi:hypothetical protein